MKSETAALLPLCFLAHLSMPLEVGSSSSGKSVCQTHHSSVAVRVWCGLQLHRRQDVHGSKRKGAFCNGQLLASVGPKGNRSSEHSVFACWQSS